LASDEGAEAPSRKIIIAGTAATLALLMSVHVFTLDGLDGLIFRSLTPDDTQFAASYSALGFWRVRARSSPPDVRLSAEEFLRDI
jgi:hypothetical protein